MTTHETEFGSADVRPHGVTVSATGDQLYRWAHRSGMVWPCSELADLDDIRAHFDTHGLVDLSTYDGSADELTAWTSDVLRGVIPCDHPCYFVTVGQFE